MRFARVLSASPALFGSAFGLFLVFLRVFVVQAVGLRGFTSKRSVSAFNPRSPIHKHRSPAPKPRSPDPKPRSRGPKTSKPSAKARSPGPKRRRPGPKPRSPDPEPRGPNLEAQPPSLEGIWKPSKMTWKTGLRKLFLASSCEIGSRGAFTGWGSRSRNRDSTSF